MNARQSLLLWDAILSKRRSARSNIVVRITPDVANIRMPTKTLSVLKSRARHRDHKADSRGGGV